MCAIVWNNLFLYGVSYSWVKDPLVPTAKQKEKEKKKKSIQVKPKTNVQKTLGSKERAHIS
jgi:hypothetical protein